MGEAAIQRAYFACKQPNLRPVDDLSAGLSFPGSGKGKSMRNPTTKKVARLGMLAALAVILVALVHFPIFPAAPFLEFDMADMPIIIGTFMFGPWWGMALVGIVSIVQGVTVSAASGIPGIVMHFVATSAYVVTAGLIYGRCHTLKGAILAMALGSIAQTLIMIPLNYIITSHFMGAPVDAITAMLLPVIIPFNLIKTVANSVLTFIIYKPVSKLLKLGMEEKAKA